MIRTAGGHKRLPSDLPGSSLSERAGRTLTHSGQASHNPGVHPLSHYLFLIISPSFIDIFRPLSIIQAFLPPSRTFSSFDTFIDPLLLIPSSFVPSSLVFPLPLLLPFCFIPFSLFVPVFYL